MKYCIKVIFTLCLLAAGTLSASAYTDRDMLTSKYTKEDISKLLIQNQKWVQYPAYSDRAGWNRFLGDKKDTYIKRGEACLDYEWRIFKAADFLEYERSGERREGDWGSNTRALANLLMAELAEGKGRFIDQIINGVYMFSETTAWAWSAHVNYQKSRRSIQAWDDPVFDLGAGELANLLSWTHYFMHEEFDKIDPEIARRLRHELKTRIMDVFLFNNSFWWMNRGEKGEFTNNWNPWCNSNALVVFMLMENDPQRLTDAVWLSMKSVDYFFNYIQGDGACEEGPSYWGVAAGKAFDYLDILSLASGGKVNIFDQDLVKKCGEYIVNSYAGDGWVVNFADASAKGGGDSYLVYRYGKAVDSPMMKGYAASRFKSGSIPSPSTDFFGTLRALDADKELQNETPAFSHKPYSWYPETQFCYLTNEAGMFLGAKGGNNGESHNHNDIGTACFYIGNVPILIDAGVGTYTRQTFSNERYSIWTMQSDYHNTPKINGVSQKVGEEHKAKGTSFDQKKMTFSTDIAGAYPEEAQVNSWVRSYTLGADRLVIKDAFTLAKAVAANQINFLTWGDVDITTPGIVRIAVKGQTAVITYDKGAFTPTTETIGINDTKLSNVWGNSVCRVSLTAKNLSKKGNYTFTVKSAE